MELSADADVLWPMSFSIGAAVLAVMSAAALPYDPGAALQNTAIQKKTYALNPAALELLGKHGFVITTAHDVRTFPLAYRTIFADDLPVYISADALMHAVFESHDDILMTIEAVALVHELRELLVQARASLARGAAAGFGDRTVAGTDEYLAVALSLLDGRVVAPVAGGSESRVRAIAAEALAARGPAVIELFGQSSNEDFSLYKPRGHYTKSERLSRYFRAMMWLGHAELRLSERGVLHRGALVGALALSRVIEEGKVRERWAAIDEIVAAFVGQPDGASLRELESLKALVGNPAPEGWRELEDGRILSALATSGGRQRIDGHLRTNDGEPTIPIPTSFFFFPQRYTIDAEVFSNLVFDRVGGGEIKRMMPSPLDVGYAVFDNRVARSLLAPELARFPYEADLMRMHAQVRETGAEYWGSSLYALWIASLRGLSSENAKGLPSVMTGEAWRRRLLNTQLASWAELRHNNILYAKQSFTVGVTCEFADAFVDPYPEFFDRLGEFAAHGERISRNLSKKYQLAEVVKHYSRLREVARRLGAIARNERAGKPISAEEMKFINGMIEVQESGVCGAPPTWSGWYAGLFYDPETITEFEPPIVDVHTQPTDAGGATVGRVLHVGTGQPRVMVVTVDTGGKPRAFVGVVSSYYEQITSGFKRLDDEEWKRQLAAGSVEDVPWMRDLIAR